MQVSPKRPSLLKFVTLALKLMHYQNPRLPRLICKQLFPETLQVTSLLATKLIEVQTQAQCTTGPKPITATCSGSWRMQYFGRLAPISYTFCLCMQGPFEDMQAAHVIPLISSMAFDKHPVHFGLSKYTQLRSHIHSSSMYTDGPFDTSRYCVAQECQTERSAQNSFSE